MVVVVMVVVVMVVVVIVKFYSYVSRLINERNYSPKNLNYINVKLILYSM